MIMGWHARAGTAKHNISSSCSFLGNGKPREPSANSMNLGRPAMQLYGRRPARPVVSPCSPNAATETHRNSSSEAKDAQLLIVSGMRAALGTRNLC